MFGNRRRVKAQQELLNQCYEVIKDRDSELAHLREELNAVRPGHWEYLVTYEDCEERHIVADGYTVCEDGSIKFYKRITRYGSRSVLQIWDPVSEVELVRILDEGQ